MAILRLKPSVCARARSRGVRRRSRVGETPAPTDSVRAGRRETCRRPRRPETSRALRDVFSHLSKEERAARMADPNADYRAFYAKAKDIHMPISRDTEVLLYMLARGNAARAIVEFGTSFGIRPGTSPRRYATTAAAT